MAVTSELLARQTAAAHRLALRGLRPVPTRPLNFTLGRDAAAFALSSGPACSPGPDDATPTRGAGEVADTPSHQSSRSLRQRDALPIPPAPVVAPVGVSAS